MLIAVLVVVGFLLGLGFRSRRIYTRGVRAGQRLTERANNLPVTHFPRRRLIRQRRPDWQLVDRQISPTRERSRTS